MSEHHSNAFPGYRQQFMLNFVKIMSEHHSDGFSWHRQPVYAQFCADNKT